MSDAEFTRAVVWALQNPGPILVMIGFFLMMAISSLGMLLVD